MKGLLIKDFRFIFKSKRMTLRLLCITIFLLFMQGAKNSAFIISYMTMVFGMLVLGTISSDEYDKSNAFFMTMPIDRNVYAREKYVFSFGCSLAGWLFATAMCTALQISRWGEVLLQAAAIFLVLSLFQCILLPVQLKFGADNGRIVLVGIVVAFMAVALMLENIMDALFPGVDAEELLAHMEGWLSSQNIWVIGLVACAVWAACLGGSLMLSERIMRKKEF